LTTDTYQSYCITIINSVRDYVNPVMDLDRLRCLFSAVTLVALFALPLAAVSPSSPDASINDTDISFSNDFPKSGETVTINVTVHNIGGMVSGPVTVRFYTDQDIIMFSEKTISNIDSNGTQTTSTSWLATIPKAYSIKVKLNCTADTNGANNDAQKTLTVSGSGTLDVKLKLDPVNCKPGQSFIAGGTVKQFNNQPVSGATVALMVKPSGASTSVTTDGNGDFSANLTSPAVAGHYEVEASASSSNLKGNDTKTLHVIQPDLVASDLIFSKTTLTEGDSVTLTATIRNNGTDTATNIIVAFYFGSTKIGTKAVDSLGTDNLTTVSIGWKSVKGTHNMRCMADPDNKVNESNEDNNAVLAPLTVKEKPGGVGDNLMMMIVVVVVIAVVGVAGVMLMKRRGKK